jgi:CHASE2 domain-containing sensor protein
MVSRDVLIFRGIIAIAMILASIHVLMYGHYWICALGFVVTLFIVVSD